MKISLAKEFSRYPSVRYKHEGKFSGEDFRERLLSPKLRQAINKEQVLEVSLDGTFGIGTSFLEEAFGGLIRIDKFKIEQLHKFMKVMSTDEPEYVNEVQDYIKMAWEELKK